MKGVKNLFNTISVKNEADVSKSGAVVKMSEKRNFAFRPFS